VVVKIKKVKVGFLYGATYTANQNSALHNLGSGSWLAIASGAAALCGLSTTSANGHWTRGCSPNQPHQAFTLVSFRQVSPLQPKLWTPDYCLLLIYRPRKDERLSWPSWLTYSGWLTHISGHPSATSRTQDSESTPAKDRCSTAGPRNQVVVAPSGPYASYLHVAAESRRITMPSPHHSVFYRPDALPDAHAAVSKHWRLNIVKSSEVWSSAALIRYCCSFCWM